MKALNRLEEEMKTEVQPGFPHVQVSIDEAKVRLLEHEPVTILSVFAFPDNEAPRLALLTGQAVAITSAGKKVAARVTDVKLVGDKKKENVVHGRASLFAPGDFSDLVGLLVILKPLQRKFDFDNPPSGVMEAARKFKDSIPKGTSVTVSSGKKSVTIDKRSKKKGEAK